MIIAGITFFGILLILSPASFLPPNPGAALFTLWLCAHGAGYGFNRMNIPPLLGYLVAGIILRNTVSSFCSTILLEWSAGIRCFGLGNILMIAGLEIDVLSLKRIGWVCFRLTVMPGVSEAIAIGVIGSAIFSMPFFLSLSMGFIIGAVSPAVVVVGMFDLQNKGYGSVQGIPSLVVAAASLDDVVAISGFSMASGLAFSTGTGSGLLGAFDGPITALFGAGVGSVTAFILLRLLMVFKTENPAVLMMAFGFLMVYGCRAVGFGGSGFLGCILMTCLCSHKWKKSHQEKMHRNCVEVSGWWWNWISEPLLFSIVGQSFDFSLLQWETIPKSCLLVIVCVFFVRVPMAFIAISYPRPKPGPKVMDFKECCFVALSWVPKATVQAALGSLPLEMIHDHIRPEALGMYNEWGREILTTAIMSILLTAPIGLFVIRFLGTKWLWKLPPDVKFQEIQTDARTLKGSISAHTIGATEKSEAMYEMEEMRFEMGDSFSFGKIDSNGDEDIL